MEPCPFCSIPADRVLLESAVAVACWDAYPVSEGHTLVVPRRHVASVFGLSPTEQQELWGLLARVREALNERLRPDGFTIGINDGAAAGQTVGHAHIHVIPRRKGDVPDPRGGIRWVIPAKAAYRSQHE